MSLVTRELVLPEISEPTQCYSLRFPKNLPTKEVSKLIYTNSGHSIMALSDNGVHKLWKWQGNERNNTETVPLWLHASRIFMTNDISDTKPDEVVSCFALSKNDCYVMSASGGEISIFETEKFKTVRTFMPPQSKATFLAFHPQDNNIIAIGAEDSSIHIYDVRVDEVIVVLKGHRKRITGLAFSNVINILISSGADCQLCVWGTDKWVKQTRKYIEIPTSRSSAPLADVHVQFHPDKIHLLAVHGTQIAIYEAPKLKCVKKWVCHEASGPITHATYSCDGHSIYASFQDGSIGVFTASLLQLRCRLNPSSYLSPSPRSRGYPLFVAAHPTVPTQFALVLSCGGAYILEPHKAEGKWGSPIPPENVAGPSTSNTIPKLEQP